MHQKNVLFKNLTTLEIGGPVKQFEIVKSEQELIKILSNPNTSSPNSYLIIGGGSNLLVSDEGMDKLVIKNEISGIVKNGNKIIVKSGTLLSDLVDFVNSNGLKGLQNLAGIPGTVGGALYGNAGAYGQTISDLLVTLKALNPENLKTEVLSKAVCAFSYRDSIFKRNKYLILEAEFELQPEDSGKLTTQSIEIIKKRLIKYPQGIKCPGSFFKNLIASSLSKEILDKIPPEKIVYGKLPSGSLLEMVGAKGDRQGQIQIAPYHANLFINLGHGTAKDFYELAKKYHQKVNEEFGIILEPEVQLINLPPLG